MGDLAVAAVRYGGRGEQGGRLAGQKIGQEGAEPVGKFIAREQPAHQQRFGEGRGEKFVATRFPGLAGAVLPEPASARSRISAWSAGSRSLAQSPAWISAKLLLKWVPTRSG